MSHKKSLYWEGWTDNVLEGYLQLILQTIACIIILLMILFYIKMLCKKNQNNVYNINIFKILLLVSLFVSLINIYGNYILSGLFILVFNFRENNNCFHRSFIQLAVIMQRLIGYTFLLIRLKVAFKGTVYEIKNIKLLLAFLWITYIIIQIILIVTTSFIKTFKCSQDKTSIIANILKYVIVISILVDIFWCFIIALMFVRRLKFVIKNSTQNSDDLTIIMRKYCILS